MQAVPPTKEGYPHWGAPLCVGVSLPLRDADMRLNVNDPRVVAEVGRDVDRRGHNGRRIKPRGGLGGSQAEAIRNCCRGGRTPEGQSVPERCRAYRWQYSAGEAYERIGVDCDRVLP